MFKKIALLLLIANCSPKNDFDVELQICLDKSCETVAYFVDVSVCVHFLKYIPDGRLNYACVAPKVKYVAFQEENNKSL